MRGNGRPASPVSGYSNMVPIFKYRLGYLNIASGHLNIVRQYPNVVSGFQETKKYYSVAGAPLRITEMFSDEIRGVSVGRPNG